MTPLRVACVGTGFIAGRHLSALADMPDVQVVAVADADEGRARLVADRFSARTYGDGLALLQAEDLDAVWLCVPPFAHGPLEQAALERGLPFFVEKPLALDLPTAVRIGAAVEERGVLAAVGYHWRSLSVVAEARQVLGDGRVQLVQGSWLDATPAAPWWSRRTGSGGQLVEQTTHLFDLARLLVGEIDTVSALESVSERDAWPGADVPTASAVVLGFRSGAVGSISSSCVLDRRHHVALRLVGEDQMVDLVERALSDHELRVSGAGVEQVVQSDEDPIAREDRSFVDALRGDRPWTGVGYAEALRTHAVVCAADRSAREGGGAVSPEQCLAEASAPAVPGGADA